MTHHPAVTEDAYPKLLKLAKNRKLDQLENAWISEIEKQVLDENEMFSAMAYLAANVDEEQAGTLLWMLLTDSRERRGREKTLQLALRSAVTVPLDPNIRQELLSLVMEVRLAGDRTETLVEMAGLDVEDKPMDAALGVYEKLAALEDGKYVLAKLTAITRPGRIERTDDGKKCIVVTVDGRENDLDAEKACTLSILKDDDFRALYEFEPERLLTMAENEPSMLARNVLATFDGRLEYKDFRNKISPSIVPKNKWTSWWRDARNAMARDPMITMTDDKEPYIVLRKTALSYEEDTRHRFIDAKTPEKKLELVLEYIEGRDVEKEPVADFVSYLKTEIDDVIHNCPPPLVVAAIQVHRELERAFPALVAAPDVTTADAVSIVEDKADVLNGLESDVLRRGSLALIRNELDSWQDMYASMFINSPLVFAEEVAEALMSEGHGKLLEKDVETVLTRPHKHPGAMLWIWKSYSQGKHTDLFPTENSLEAAVVMIGAADMVTRLSDSRKELRPAGIALRGALGAKDAAFLKQLIADASTEQAKKIKSAVSGAVCLKDSLSEAAFGALRKHHWKIFEDKKKIWEEDYIYTTAEGLARRKEEFQELTTVKMAENAQAIGKAAELGDISDNADFRVALQERDLLAERAATMQAELELSRELNPADIPKDSVSIGSRVTAEDPVTGETLQYTFLGPWDVDLEKNIYSYKAPIAQEFMGKKPGEAVEIPTETGKRELILKSTEPAI